MDGMRMSFSAPALSWRTLLTSLVVCSVLGAAIAGDVSPSAAEVALPKRACPNVGPAQTDVGLYKIITRRVKCGMARAILRRWYHDVSQKDSGPDGWRCAEVRRGRYEIRSYCHRSKHLIAFSRYLA
jgi:hypothetical protein